MNELEVIKEHIINLHRLTRGIREIIGVPKLGYYLINQNHYLPRLVEIRESLMNIKTSIEVTHKIDMPANERYVRNYITDLVDAIDSLVSNIKTCNDNLIVSYNYEVIEILNRSS